MMASVSGVSEWAPFPESAIRSDEGNGGSILECVRSLSDQIEFALQKSGWNGSFRNNPERLQAYEYRNLTDCIYQVKSRLYDLDLMLTISLPHGSRTGALLSCSFSV